MIIANSGALPEVAGDAAIQVDPHDIDGLARALHMVLDNADLRTALKKKGLSRVKQFAWSESARQTLDVYRTMCR